MQVQDFVQLLRSMFLPPLMLVMFFAMQIMSKLGFSRPMFAFMGRRMQSPRLKARAFRGYRPTAHDVFVCTYSKSGTNWAMQIAYQIAQRGEGEYEHIHDEVAWPEAPMPRIVSLSEERTYRRAPTGLRVIKTHLESNYVPYSPDAKYIVVVRDPKDVFVSSYFFAGGMLPGANMLPVADWYGMFLSAGFPYGSWVEHLASFWPWRGRHNVLLLTFGEMKADLPGTVRRIAALMGVELSAAETALVVEKSSFAYMKRIDHKFAPAMPFPLNRLARPVMVRKGQQGGSSELLATEQQEAIDRYMRAELRRRDCDVPYDELFVTADEPTTVVAA